MLVSVQPESKDWVILTVLMNSRETQLMRASVRNRPRKKMAPPIVQPADAPNHCLRGYHRAEKVDYFES